MTHSPFFTMPKLRYLDVSNNNIGGSTQWHLIFPEDGFSKIEYIDISNNDFGGVMPTKIKKLQTSLKHFDASHNKMENIFIIELHDLKKLRYLNLNNFGQGSTQVIPDWIGNFPLLEFLSLANTNLEGPIPTGLKILGNLKMLDLGHNELEGGIPTDLSELPKLQYLLLNDNKLDDVVPPAITAMDTLDVFLVDGNSVSGDLGQNAKVDGQCRIGIMSADCAKPSAGSPHSSKEVDCTCCTLCCEDLMDSCEETNWDYLIQQKEATFQDVRQEMKFQSDRGVEGYNYFSPDTKYVLTNTR